MIYLGLVINVVALAFYLSSSEPILACFSGLAIGALLFIKGTTNDDTL